MAFGEAADGAHVRVGEVGGKAEVVVVDHDAHLLTDRGQPFLHLGGDGLQPGGCVHRQAFHVEEEDVALRVVGEARLQWNGEQIALEPHRLLAKDPLVHQLRLAFDDGCESEVGQHIVLQIDARSDLDEFQTPGASPNTQRSVT